MAGVTMPARPASTRSAGFTLLELLVVLLIMGLMVGLASAIVRPDDRGLLRVEAERLAQVLDLASAEARLTGTAIAWTADGTAYRFWRQSGEADWSELVDSDELRARSLPSGMRIASLQVENLPARDLFRLEFAPHAAPAAFKIDLSLGAAHYAVEGSPIGELTLVAGTGGSLGDAPER